MKNLLFFILVLISSKSIAQINGTVTDSNGKPLASVSIHIEDTYLGTTTNDEGEYFLNVPGKGKYVIVYQYLGYKSQKIKYVHEKRLKTFDIKLEEENIELQTVVIDKKNNPANEVIRNAIAHKKENSEPTDKYQAYFYSRGIFKIKEAPKKIMGQKFDSFDEMLDSTRSGILYLSETVSKITYKKPDKMKEVIVASKVSGNDNGFSFNTADSANFDFYENYLPFQINAVSPIADNAFNYYKYKMEGTFFNENNIQINKIKVTPKRNNEPAMEGYLYIVEDSWAIYAVDLSIKGDQVQMPAVNSLQLKQNFSYNRNNKIWAKNTQTLDFVAGMLGIKISGRFSYVYSNYVFEPKFDNKTFSREVLSFEENANKKDDLYWSKFRLVPLTSEESNDYLKKDLLQTKKKSKQYLDSIDAKRNKFGFSDPIMGYSYKNSFKKWELSYDGLIKGINFNTVQGWDINTDFTFMKRDEDTRTYTQIKTYFDYGLSEEKFRSYVTFIKKFSNISQSELRFGAGSKVYQFNGANPIGRIVNSVSTLFFKDNYIKLYERNFVNASYGREIINGLNLNAELSYAERKPLFNTTDFVILKKDQEYTSNNPLLPNDNVTPAIIKHNLAKVNLGTRINFAQEYLSRPDGKFNVPNDKYPVLYFNYEKGFAGNESNYDFDHINARVTYDLTLGNKGNVATNMKAGKFYHAENIAFIDYKHFDGNQTHVGTEDRYLNVFNLLPYYSSSTNDSYVEIHAEHDDSGYIMNKIPLLKKLKSTLVLGYHNLSVPKRSPYHEYSVGLNNLGFGKFKVFRLDYVHAYQSGWQADGFVFGLKILDFLQ
ncbi:MAG: carboxypeptidase-like regulatory domain-containing protein [Flavobacterium sp.]|nr:carboxypeptidase-like regulatory domain-containing protein [Flavobacterium sp.]